MFINKYVTISSRSLSDRCAPFFVLVTSPNQYACKRQRTISLEEPEGYIANVVTEETGCGSFNHPWSIQSQSTQRINMTMMDFGVTNTSDVDQNTVTTCNLYAIIREDHKEHRICGGRDRDGHIFMSDGPHIEIYLSTPVEAGGNHFVIKYEGKLACIHC